MLTFKTTQQPDGSWTARLGERAIACDAATEHEAIERLLTWVAELVEAGCLDSTGCTAEEIARKRYNRVFPQSAYEKPSDGASLLA
jgi:hypothetical protein